MKTVIEILAVVSILANAAIYGTDFFCAIVLRPALRRVDDSVLTRVMGEVHRYGDRRMPVPGAIGLVTALLSVILAAVSGRPGAAIAAAVATVALTVWLVVYVRVSAPVNKQLTAAAAAGTTPGNARALQRTWDGVINLRVALQLIALLALCCAVIAT
jgi:Domain of unknown function (DUF1772)